MNETLFVRPVFSAACKMKASLRGTRKRRTVAFRHKDVARRGPDRRLPPLGQETKIFAETALGNRRRSAVFMIGAITDGKTARLEGVIDVKSRRPGTESS